MSLEAAGQHIIHEKLKKAGGAGGLIAIDKNGNITMPFNTPGMYRGYARPGEREVGLFGAMAE
jgi:beta-aspartyl-peptidase (threonine type)